MKFNITVDIDWLEENSLDEEIKESIVNGVVERISNETVLQVKEAAEERITARIEDLVSKTYNDFLSQSVTLTNDWGEVIKESITVSDLIKERLNNWLTEKVDENGNGSRYNANRTRMEWIVNDQMQKESKRMADDMIKKVNAEIKNYINDSVKSSIGEKLVKEIGIENLINKGR